MFLIGFGAALSLPAQEVTVAPPQGSSATTSTSPDATRATRGAADSGRASTPSSPAVNPLEGYLAEWMRPRDHALLRKEAATPTRTAAESWRRLATSSPVARTPAPKPVSASTNPYIEAMNAASNPSVAGTVNSTQPTQTTLASPVTGPTTSPASLAEPEAPPPTPATRYQPPPSSDAKYFPQLKRF